MLVKSKSEFPDAGNMGRPGSRDSNSIEIIVCTKYRRAELAEEPFSILTAISRVSQKAHVFTI